MSLIWIAAVSVMSLALGWLIGMVLGHARGQQLVVLHDAELARAQKEHSDVAARLDVALSRERDAARSAAEQESELQRERRRAMELTTALEAEQRAHRMAAASLKEAQAEREQARTEERRAAEARQRAEAALTAESAVVSALRSEVAEARAELDQARLEATALRAEATARRAARPPSPFDVTKPSVFDLVQPSSRHVTFRSREDDRDEEAVATVCRVADNVLEENVPTILTKAPTSDSRASDLAFEPTQVSASAPASPREREATQQDGRLLLKALAEDSLLSRNHREALRTVVTRFAKLPSDEAVESDGSSEVTPHAFRAAMERSASLSRGHRETLELLYRRFTREG